MAKSKKIKFSVFLTFVVIVVGLPLGAFFVSVWNEMALEEQIKIIFADVEDPAFIPTYIGIAGVITFLAVMAYFLSFQSGGVPRPRLRLYFTFVATAWVWSVLLVTNRDWYEMFVEFPGAGGALAITFLGPLIIWPAEKAIRNVTTTLGKASVKHKNHFFANFFLNIALKFPPYTEELEKAYALALCESGKVESALSFLEENWKGGEGELQTRLLGYLARYYKDNERDEDAITAFEELSRRHEGNVAIGKDLVSLYLKIGEVGKALEILKVIGNFDDFKFLQYVISLFIDVKDYDSAVEHCRRLKGKEGRPYTLTKEKLHEILEHAPKNAAALRFVVDLNLTLDETEAAIENLERIHKIDPDDDDVIDKLKELYRSTFQYLSLEKIIRRQARKHVQDKELQYELVEVLIQNQHFDDAHELLEELVVAFQDDYRFWTALANILYRKKEYVSARDALMSALDNCPIEKQNPLIFLKNKIFSALMNTELKRYQRAVEENPKDPQVRFQLVEQLFENNFPERAATELDELIYNNPSCKDQVLEFAENLLDKKSGSFILMNYLADLHLREKKYDRAMDLYHQMKELSLHPEAVLRDGCERILQLSPDFPPAIFEMGVISRLEKSPEMAVQYFLRYLELVPEPSLEEKVNLYRALFYDLYTLGRYREAERFGPELIQMEPAIMEHYRTMGEIMESQERLEEALDFFIKACERDPENRHLSKRKKDVENAQKKRRIGELKNLLEQQGADNVPALLEVGDLHFYFEEYNEALFQYQKAEKLPGGQVIGKAKVGYALAVKGLDSIAEEHLEQIKLNDEHISDADKKSVIDTFYEIGKHYESLRDYARALEYYKQIFNIDATYSDIVERLERIEPKAARMKKFSSF